MRRHYGNEDGEQRGKVKAGEVGGGGGYGANFN